MSLTPIFDEYWRAKYHDGVVLSSVEWHRQRLARVVRSEVAAALAAAEARERALAAECARLREALEGAYRQIRDIVRGHPVECCITCAHPKSRSNVDGEEVVLGWPECINPSCVAHGDRVASASYGPALTPPARAGGDDAAA